MGVLGFGEEFFEGGVGEFKVGGVGGVEEFDVGFLEDGGCFVCGMVVLVLCGFGEF